MGLSRQTRIITLLVIDTAFFFLELIVGYAVGSLALVADSFHMLNDVLSLIVALYTIRLATSPSSAKNSYGWQRAEILGALINGVFLIALCVSIALEAVGRIFAPPEISNPKLIVIVGSLGLLSNIVGLVLFHEHGHSHGGHSHGPSKPTGPIALPPDNEAEPVAIEGRRRSGSMSSLYQHPAETRAQIIEAARLGTSYEEGGYLSSMSPTNRRSISTRHRHSSAGIKAPIPGSNETLPPGHSPSATPAGEDAPVVVTPATPKVPEGNLIDPSAAERGEAHSNGHQGHGHDHDHDHDKALDLGGHGHSHGSMNMRGVFLHVLGDALGNIGVISAGLVIWFCEGRWTLYFDPGVSLLITVIIFSSAIPLVKSASAILLQAVPNHVSLDEVRDAVKRIDGVFSVHELHIWQLSETTSVASVHVLILPGYDYMEVANRIRQCMHSQGIHSVTIQPEFVGASRAPSDDGTTDLDERTCLIRCPPDQCVADTCCPPSATDTPLLSHVSEGDERSNHSGHSH